MYGIPVVSPAATALPHGASVTTSRNGSTTATPNLTLLCRYHHHNYATGGWTCLINTRITAHLAAQQHRRQ